MGINRSLEAINQEFNIMQEQNKQLEKDKKDLENMIFVQEGTILACHNSNRVKELVEDNMRLKVKVEYLTERLDISSEIINNMRMSLELIRSELKPNLNSEEIHELYNQGMSVLKIAQLCNTSKASITDIIRKIGRNQAKQEQENHTSQSESQL